jgi:type IV pilus assembly protein PilO
MALLPTNQRDQIMVIICVVALGLAGVYYMYLWSPRNVELTTLQARVDTLIIQNEAARRDVARGTASRLKEEAEQYGRILGLMRQLVPTANEVPTLLEQISTAARRTGLDISGVTPLGVVPGEVFDTHKYQMAVTGSYHRIAQLLGNIGSLTRIVAPMNLTLMPTTRDLRSQTLRAGESVLDATFEIQTYVAKTAATAPPAAPTP